MLDSRRSKIVREFCHRCLLSITTLGTCLNTTHPPITSIQHLPCSAAINGTSCSQCRQLLSPSYTLQSVLVTKTITFKGNTLIPPQTNYICNEKFPHYEMLSSTQSKFNLFASEMIHESAFKNTSPQTVYHYDVMRGKSRH